MESGVEKCSILIIKSGKWHKSEGIEQQNPEKIRTLGEKVTYKYLGTLEVDTIKQVGIKAKKYFKNTSGKREKYSKENYRAKIVWKW